MNKNIGSAIKDKLINEAHNDLDLIAENVKQLKDQLKIPNTVAQHILKQFNQSYINAAEGIKLVGGSEDEVAKLWGYNFASYLYDYLADRDNLQSRQALSFIRMQLGHELNNRIGTEYQFSSFILGLSLRFVRGFEKLKNNLAEIESELSKFEEFKYIHKSDDLEESDTDLFGRERKIE